MFYFLITWSVRILDPRKIECTYCGLTLGVTGADRNIELRGIRGGGGGDFVSIGMPICGAMLLIAGTELGMLL